MARTMSGEKRRIGVAMYWVRSEDDMRAAHLLARLGGYDSMTGLVRAVVDAELAILRARFGDLLARQLESPTTAE